ncbi:MAG: SRPBCC domain-containing protein [Anaerolineae bacterium]|nr:SRPBCC domain-containing protein [Anaerolineae bacterium]
MRSDTRSLTFEQTIPVPPAAVYRAYTNSSALREWLADVATTATQPGGRIYLAWNDGYYVAGSFTRLEPGKEAAFTWYGRGEPGPSAVRVTLTPEGENSTHVVVRHEGLGVSESLSTALGAHRAGDTVDVTFYRGSAKRTVPMTLSGRPVPELPVSLAELAVAVRERYEQIEAELDEFFAGVDEAAAFHKPGLEEWSAAEVVAHFIHGERYQNQWLAELADGHEGWHDDWGGNVHAQVAATVAAYPSVVALLDELKRHHVEMVAFIKNLPADFAERKGSYWRLAYNLLEEPFHHEAHLEQMRAAIAQASAMKAAS